MEQYRPMDPWEALSFSKMPNGFGRFLDVIFELKGDLLKSKYHREPSSGWRSFVVKGVRALDSIPRNLRSKIESVYIYSEAGPETLDLRAISDFTNLKSLSIGAHIPVCNPDHFKSFPNLRRLAIDSAVEGTIPFESLTKLEELAIEAKHLERSIEHCENLNYVQLYKVKASGLEIFSSMRRLRRIDIVHASQIFDLSTFFPSENLKVLSLTHCPQLTGLNGFLENSSLSHLLIEACSNLSSANGVEELRRLSYLEFRNCKNLSDLDSVQHLKAQFDLFLIHCPKIDRPEFERVVSSAKVRHCCRL